jgi:hypothetical protein
MPDTEVIALLEGMPAIDGRQPTVMYVEDGLPWGVFYGDASSPDASGLVVMPTDAGDIEPIPEVIGNLIAEYEAEGMTVEGSALDPNGTLVWVAATDGDGYAAVWAEPDGAWIFSLQGDSPEFRTEMIDALTTTVEG